MKSVSVPVSLGFSISPISECVRSSVYGFGSNKKLSLDALARDLGRTEISWLVGSLLPADALHVKKVITKWTSALLNLSPESIQVLEAAAEIKV